MTAISVRKSGGARIVSIPKSVLDALNLSEGSQLELSLVSNQIVLTPIKKETLTLESLLEASPKECFAVTQEDQEWMNSRFGREL